MDAHTGGYLTGAHDAARLATAATLATRDDFDATTADASAIARDGIAFIVKGLRYLELEADFAERVCGTLAATRLAEGDDARRNDRAALLRALADLIERESVPTPDELEAVLPDRIAGRILTAALEGRLRSRSAGLDRQPTRAIGDPGRCRLRGCQANAARMLARRIKFAALGLFHFRHADK